MLLSKATDEAQAERQRLLDEVADGRRGIECETPGSVEKRRAEPASSNQPPDAAGSICYRTKGATDLATTSLEERLGEVFTRRLREMDSQAKAGLGEALKTASDPAVLRTRV